MKKYIVVCISILVLIGAGLVSPADAKVVTREVTAIGATQQEAVTNALIEAVQQVKGLKIADTEELRTLAIEQDSQTDGRTHNSSAMQTAQYQNILKETHGIISAYEILKIHKAKEKRGWKAYVRVHIPIYHTPGLSPENRRKIAVIPFHATRTFYSFQGRRVSASEISRQFTQQLVNELTQTRKFAVLDREYKKAFLNEKKLIMSADAPIAEQAKIGHVLGADYLLIGTITDAGIKRIPYTIQMTGESGYHYSGTFLADYRILAVATRQVKWSDSVTVSLGNNTIKRLSPNLQPEKIQEIMFKKAAKQLVDRALDDIYPIRVVEIQPNGETVLNQGGVTLVDGEVLNIFNPGKKIRDPYTGESLGASEIWAATIRIDRVTPKMSYAKVIKGKAADIQKGSICRRVAKKGGRESGSSASGQSQVKTLPNGGVVLPFD